MAKRKEVPKVDVNSPAPSSDRPPIDRYEGLEFRRLEAEAKTKENVLREDNQRYLLRWMAVVTCLVIIIGMGYMLGHVVHRLMVMKAFGAPSGYIIAVYVAPIFSMTSLSIALLVAAFRGFKGGDGDTSFKALSEGAKVGKLMQ